MIQQFERLSLSSQDYLFSQINDSDIPSQLLDSAPIDKIDSMHLKNFKSFDDKYVGPFLDFTCIIGPNGSGKSNILEALMFCFCSESSRHTLLDARELINRQGKQTFKQLGKMNKICTVTAVFILANERKLTISRSIDPEGKETYSIDYTTVTKKMYQNILLRKGINCACPNYAIWQGQIDRLLLKEPVQLTNLFENLSGSIYFKKPYDEANENFNNINKRVQENSKKIDKLKVDQRNLKTMKVSSNQYHKWEAQYLQVMKKMYLIKILEKESILEEMEKEYKNLQSEESKRIDELNEMKANAQRDHLKRKQLQERLNHAMTESAERHAILKQIGNPANILKVQQLKELQQQIASNEKQIEELEARGHSLAQSIPEIPSSELIEEYLVEYEKWEQENTALHRQLNKKKAEVLYIEGMLQNKQELLQQFEDKKRKHEQRRLQKGNTIKSLRADVATLEHSISLLKKESAQIDEEMKKGKGRYEQKQKQFNEICASIEQLEAIISEQANDEKEAVLLKNLGNIDGFHGSIDQKIKPSAAKFGTCFPIIFSTINKYLLCQNQKGSRSIGDRLSELSLMKTVVILDNVHESRNNQLRKAVGKSDGIMAIDAVDYDKDVKGFKEFLTDFLKGKVIVDDMKAAYRMRNKNIEGLKEIYTLDGNILRQDGTISAHGNPAAIQKQYKYNSKKSTVYQDLTNFNKQKLKLEAQLRSLGFRFDEKEIIKKNLEIDNMQQKREKLLNQIAQLEVEDKQELKVPKNIISEMETLEKQRDKLNEALLELERMIQTSKIFDQFKKKHKITNLQSFRNANNFEHIEHMMKKKQNINKEIALIQAEVEKLGLKIKNAQKMINAKEEQINKIPLINQKQKFEQEIEAKEKEMVDLRNQISKLNVMDKNLLNGPPSQLPALEAKIAYFKQKMVKQLEQLSYDYGVDYRYPIPREEIAEELNLGKRARITQNIIEGLEEKVQFQKARIQEHLDKYNTLNLVSNLNQDEERLQSIMKDLKEETEALIEDRKKLTEDLELIRRDRAKILVDFINQLRPIVADSYRILTRQDDGLVGNADLHIENGEYPFDYGIYFSPTPPTKRFVYDLEQLSGGEKSIASLALQYSLAIATKVSFLILDETDAFLDSNNVGRFLNLINHSLQDSKIQIIVVSHKQGLFSNAQSLLGVTRPKSHNLSQVYSLKL